MDVLIAFAPFALLTTVINLINVFLKLTATDALKLMEEVIKYAIYTGPFLLLVADPLTRQQAILWLAVPCTFKMFQTAARLRIENLNASPSETPSLRLYTALFRTLLTNFTLIVYWNGIQMTYHKFEVSFGFLLSVFEPLSIAYQTLHDILVHGFQLLGIWLQNSERDATNSENKVNDFLWERKRVILRNVGFFVDITALLLSMAHYDNIWALHGMTFHLVDAMLVLPLLSLLIAVVKRTWEFVIEIKMGEGAT